MARSCVKAVRMVLTCATIAERMVLDFQHGLSLSFHSLIDFDGSWLPDDFRFRGRFGGTVDNIAHNDTDIHFAAGTPVNLTGRGNPRPFRHDPGRGKRNDIVRIFSHFRSCDDGSLGLIRE